MFDLKKNNISKHSTFFFLVTDFFDLGLGFQPKRKLYSQT